MKACICAHSAFDVPNHRLFFFAKELVRRGIDLTFVFPGKNNADSCRQHFEGADIKQAGLNVSRFSASKIWLYPVFANRARQLFEGNFEFVYGICLPAAIAVCSSKTKSPKIVDYLDLWSAYWDYANPSIKGRIIGWAVKRGEGYTLKKADKVFTISKALASQLEGLGAENSKMRIVRDGVDTKKFRRFKVKSAFYDRYNLEKGTEYVIFQGGIAAHDGLQFLVDAAPSILKKHPNLKFLIVGSGTYENIIKQKISACGLDKSFIFTGWAPYSDMPSFMNIAKMNCVPLPDAPATHGVITYKLFEGIACGTPAVIGNMPAVRETLTHLKDAYLVKSENKERLAEGINKLLEEPKLYARLKMNGLNLVKNHDWRDIAKDMADLFGV